MNGEDYRIDILQRAEWGMRTTCPANSFIKITHIKSGISVTKYGKTQIKARDKALEELEEIVKKWENN